MIGMKKKWIHLIIITLVVSVFFSHPHVFAAPDVSAYIAKLTADEGFNTTQNNVKFIIDKYCSAVLSSDGFIQGNFIYNAKQSAFVHLFCKNTSPYFKEEDKYFIRKDYKELGLTDVVDGNNLCSSVSMSNDCDLSNFVPKLFDDIIIDYVSMKQANFYGLIGNFTTDPDMEKQLNIFSKAYFDRDICDKASRYPSTCRTMKGYLKNARNLLSDVRIFNAPGILDMALPIAEINAQKNREPEKFKPSKLQSCGETDLTKDIFLCGLYGDTAGSLVSFTNLVYNELFYYRLFMGYYFTMLQKNPTILINNTRNTDINKLIKKSSNQYIRSKDALSLTLRMMRDTYMAYPFHIGMLMYQEDLHGFGKLLAKITTPIYTLYDKLRNVQSK
ncbi:MAG: hypothetical protein WC010_03680 [Candidatus Absconditabacterales bacterium]